MTASHLNGTSGARRGGPKARATALFAFLIATQYIGGGKALSSKASQMHAVALRCPAARKAAHTS